MVTVQLYDTGQILEAKDAKITYVKTAGDLGELTSVNSSYSWSMKFPKTPQNTQVLDGLGLVGSGSRKPYEKIYCNLLDNGFPIAIKALLNIRETSDEYGIYIQEGFIDFIKDITNDTIGESLDLSPLDHTRDYSTIYGSLDLSLPYAYLISDVNGGYLPNENDTTNMDPEYMAPFANVGYLWDLIFSTYGWTFEINEQVRNSIDGTWMSYPSEIVFGEDNAEQAGDFTATNQDISDNRINTGFYPISFSSFTLNNDYLTPANVSGEQFIVKQNGNYKIDYKSLGYVRYYDRGGNLVSEPYRTFILVNNQAADASSVYSDVDQIESTQLQLNEGDIITMAAQVTVPAIDRIVVVQSGEMTVQYLEDGEVSFTQALIKYKIADFIKEVMTREALTPFVNSMDKHIEFLTLDERLGYDFEDWSELYSKRISETYLYRDYAQNNYLRHKYNDDNEDFNDGVLTIDNANLETEKDIYNSNSFSPSQQLSTFVDSGGEYKVPILQMFDAEVKDNEGVLEIEYKFLKDRFFFVKHTNSSRDIYIYTNLVEGFPMVSVNGATYRDIITSKYTAFERMSEDAKVHQIELAIPLVNIVTLDLRKVVYFRQEANYYILNRLTYKTGEMSRAEFLRIEPELIGGNGAFSNAFNGSFSI